MQDITDVGEGSSIHFETRAKVINQYGVEVVTWVRPEAVYPVDSMKEASEKFNNMVRI